MLLLEARRPCPGLDLVKLSSKSTGKLKNGNSCQHTASSIPVEVKTTTILSWFVQGRRNYHWQTSKTVSENVF